MYRTEHHTLPFATLNVLCTAARLAKPFWNCARGRPQQRVLRQIWGLQCWPLSGAIPLPKLPRQNLHFCDKLNISIHILILPPPNNFLTHCFLTLWLIFFSSPLKLLYQNTEVQTTYVSWLVYIVILFLHVEGVKFCVAKAYGKPLATVPFVESGFPGPEAMPMCNYNVFCRWALRNSVSVSKQLSSEIRQFQISFPKQLSNASRTSGPPQAQWKLLIMASELLLDAVLSLGSPFLSVQSLTVSPGLHID